MSTLREQMLADLQLKGLTPKTQKIYLREVRKSAKYFKKSPEELGLSVMENLKHRAILTITYSAGQAFRTSCKQKA